MNKTVLIRQAQRFGGDRFLRATVLSQHGDDMTVVPEAQQGMPEKAITVKASTTRSAERLFSTRHARQRGIVVQKSLPDSPNCLSRMLERRGL